MKGQTKKNERKMIGINRGAEKGQKVCKTVLCGAINRVGNALK